MAYKLRYVLCWSYWIALCGATHLPPSKMIQLPTTWFDKVLHVLTFILLGLLASWAYKVNTLKQVVIIITILTTYAAIDECTQSLVGRTPDLYDWIVDTIGILAGVLTAYMCLKKSKENLFTGEISKS